MLFLCVDVANTALVPVATVTCAFRVRAQGSPPDSSTITPKTLHP